tara:strand:- start:155 stop:457 length:303 start_codon:yes stop_codon:yes gene_type:complete
MSVHISVSNSNQKNCDSIIEKLLISGIDARIIETKSIINKELEYGCIITLDPEYSSKKNVHNVWNIIKKDYICSHLKIDGLFDGCIFDYLKPSICPYYKN